jgi:ABC-2 type transport system ATP-binding protein
VHRPPVLFLDEPTTGLDPMGRKDLWVVIEELARQGTTVLLTTQYLEEADRLADQIVVIDNGRVIARGTASELKASLGATIVEVALADERGAERASLMLETVGSTNVNVHTVEVKVEGGGRDVLEVVRILDREGIFPDTLTVREPTLDDVFQSLTGHKAEEITTQDAPAEGQPGRRAKRGAA